MKFMAYYKLRIVRIAIFLMNSGMILNSCGGDNTPQPPPPDGNEPQPPPEAPPENLPDLVISLAAREPNHAIVPPGTEVRFSFNVRNIGNGAYNQTILVSGPGNYSGSISGGLDPMESKTAVVKYPVYSRGATYSMVFNVDPDNIIKESNESNNSSQALIVKTSN